MQFVLKWTILAVTMTNFVDVIFVLSYSLSSLEDLFLGSVALLLCNIGGGFISLCFLLEISLR